MELLYIWKERGFLMDDTSFNFSSKYLFIATKDAKQKKIDITVSINSNYIDNFFWKQYKQYNCHRWSKWIRQDYNT